MRKQKPSPRHPTRRNRRSFSDVTVVPDDDDEAVIGPGNEK